MNSPTSTTTDPPAKLDTNANYEKEAALTGEHNGRNDTPTSPLAGSPQAGGSDIEKVPSLGPTDPSAFPDGGAEAWLVVLGCFCILIVSFGWINCIGIFQDYYETHQLTGYSPSQVAWIPALESFCMFAGGLWVGWTYDAYGPRHLLLIGSILHVFGLMMTSISTQYYQFLLAQGLCSALGASMVFYPAIACTVSWFYKKRAFALGITAAGSGLGGIIFPLMVQRLVPKVGFGWTMRICAFLILALLVVANLTTHSRLTPTPRGRLTPRVLLNPFKELDFCLFCIGMFCVFLGVFQVFTFLVTAGVARGLSNTTAVYLVPIMNAGSVVGRILPLFVADKIGVINVFCMSSFITTLMVFCVWVPVSGTTGTVVFSVIFGFTSGTTVAIANAAVAQISDPREIGLRSGVAYFCVSIAVLMGSPIGGAIATAGGYRAMQCFSGSLCLIGALFFVALRIRLAGRGVLTKV